MGHTIVGVFQHSGDADLAAAHLRDEFALDADELDILGEADWAGIGKSRPSVGAFDTWMLSAASGGVIGDPGDEDPVLKRWGDMVWDGRTVIVARSDDPDIAQAIARDMRETGADRIDLLPH